MNRFKDEPGIFSYYEALEKNFKIQSEILTKALPHSGERGSNNELYLKQFLEKVLPKRFGIGSGFIISSDPNKEPSNQNDIIIYDHYWNSPIYNELTSNIYPIECIYATIEVKSKIVKNKQSDLDKALENIAKIRNLSKDKKYVKYIPHEEKPQKLVAYTKQYINKTPPRSYIFSFSKKGWRNIEAFGSHLQKKAELYSDSHLHGICILDKDWFAYQIPYSEKKEFEHFENHSLLRFTNKLLRGIQSFEIDKAYIDDYHGVAFGYYVGEHDSTCPDEPAEEYYDNEQIDDV